MYFRVSGTPTRFSYYRCMIQDSSLCPSLRLRQTLGGYSKLERWSCTQKIFKWHTNELRHGTILRVLCRVCDSTTDSGATPIGRMDSSIQKICVLRTQSQTMAELKVSTRVYDSNRHSGATPIGRACRAPYEFFDCDPSDQYAKNFLATLPQLTLSE